MATMREERANFRFLLVAAALLLVAAIVTVTSFASLVNAGDSSNAASANPANVSGQIGSVIAGGVVLSIAPVIANLL